MKQKTISTILFLVLMTFVSFGQGQNNNWHFGNHCVVDFNNGQVVSSANSSITTYEPSAAISDSAGNLLFYTNAQTIWDRNNNVMPNGNNIACNLDVQQGVLIVPKPNSSNIFYVFTIGDTGGVYNRKLFYSIVDMSLNGGFGDVTSKNVFIHSAMTEKMTATKHANGNDFWVVTHPESTNQFMTFLIDQNGLNLNPIMSTAGMTSPTFLGAIKISQNGCWIISSYRAFPNPIEVLHFDNSTGMVSGNASAPTNGIYGIEISPGSSKFYLYELAIVQYDLLQPTDSLILASKTNVSNPFCCPTAFQLAPNGKIYYTGSSDSTLGAIEYPDSLGLACSINNSAIYFYDSAHVTVDLPNNFNLAYQGALTCSTTSIEETINQSSISVTPNPTNGEITLHINQLYSGEIAFSLSNLLGQKLFIRTFNKQDGLAIKINLPDLSEGLYIYSVETDNGRVFTNKLILNN